MEIVLKPHRTQAPLIFTKQRVQPVVAGRGWGKSYLHRMRALVVSLCFDDWCKHWGRTEAIDSFSPPVSAIVMPTQKQCRAIHWLPLVATLEGHPLVKDINRTAMRIDFHGNRPSLVCLGANDNNGDNLRGYNFINLQLDEYQDFKPMVWELVLLPAMVRVQGYSALVTGTPKGKLNIYYKLAETYGYEHFTTLDNPHIDQSKVLEAKATLPESLFNQEFLATWEEFAGKVFSELDEQHLTEEDVATKEYNLVVMGVDHGDVYPSHVVWGRDADDVWWYVDGWSPDSGAVVNEIDQSTNIAYLAARWGVKGIYCDPSRPSRILTIRSLPGCARAISGFNRVQEGLTELNALLVQGRLKFSKRTAASDNAQHRKHQVSGEYLYQLFNAYHRATDKLGRVTDKIAEGQFDHPVDASRYALATGKPLIVL